MFVSDVGELKINQAFSCFKKNGENIFISACEIFPIYLLYTKKTVSLSQLDNHHDTIVAQS